MRPMTSVDMFCPSGAQPSWAEEGQEPAARSKNGVQKKRRPVSFTNMVQFSYENGDFENNRVQKKLLSWRKIRALARGVSPAPKARGRGPLGKGGWGFRAWARRKFFYLSPLRPGFVLKRTWANQHNHAYSVHDLSIIHAKSVYNQHKIIHNPCKI